MACKIAYIENFVGRYFRFTGCRSKSPSSKDHHIPDHSCKNCFITNTMPKFFKKPLKPIKPLVSNLFPFTIKENIPSKISEKIISNSIKNQVKDNPTKEFIQNKSTYTDKYNQFKNISKGISLASKFLINLVIWNDYINDWIPVLKCKSTFKSYIPLKYNCTYLARLTT